MNTFITWAKERLTEKSTWITIFTAIAGATGYVVAPEYQEIIIQVAAAVLGGTAFIVKETK